MSNQHKKTFVARTIYHHAKRTTEHVTLLVYRDENDLYELFDDREAEHESIAGGQPYVFEEWGKRNRQLIQDGFQRDHMSGENEWQRYIA